MAAFVCIREFDRRLEADRAESILAAESIMCVLVHDDAGGWWDDWIPAPAWARARLMVTAEDAERARRVLDAAGPVTG